MEHHPEAVNTDTTPAPDAATLQLLDAWWRAVNYLTIGQIYLHGNPPLREPRHVEHIKPCLLGHWAPRPG